MIERQGDKRIVFAQRVIAGVEKKFRDAGYDGIVSTVMVDVLSFYPHGLDAAIAYAYQQTDLAMKRDAELKRCKA